MDEKDLVSPPAGSGEITEESKNTSVLIRRIGEVDRPFMFLVIALVCFGSVMIFSSSYAYAQNVYGDSFHFAKNQVFFAVLGIGAMIVVSKFIRHRLILRLAWLGYFIALALNLGVVFMGFIGNGAQRWIDLGFVRFQPSEVLKFMTVVICAKIITVNQNRIKSFKYGILPFIILMIPTVILLFYQSHLSATIITLLLIYFMMFLGGSDMRWLGTIGGLGFAGVVFVITNVNTIVQWDFVREKLGHVYNRLLVWNDPLKYMKDAASGDAGWQPSQSLFAISSGGFWGVGLGQSMEKHGYLPEPQNDYIFSIICEEMGFVGAIIVIGLFVALILRGFHIARNCKDRFCQLLVSGLMMKIGLQVILNIAVVTNTIPSTGISLPFFSYGGTALVIALVEMGVVLSISRYSYSVRQ